jgi:hypothetical protein
MVSVSGMLTSNQILDYRNDQRDRWVNQYSDGERLESVNIASNIEIPE